MKRGRKKGSSFPVYYVTIENLNKIFQPTAKIAVKKEIALLVGEYFEPAVHVKKETINLTLEEGSVSKLKNNDDDSNEKIQFTVSDFEAVK
jgi:hypothetical protein